LFAVTMIVGPKEDPWYRDDLSQIGKITPWTLRLGSL
jgi:hypothetical protein